MGISCGAVRCGASQLMSNTHRFPANGNISLEIAAPPGYNLDAHAADGRGGHEREVTYLQDGNFLTIVCDRQKVSLDIRTILYINMHENMAEIHTSGGRVYKTLSTLEKLETTLGDGFLKPHRSRLVSVMAIHDITDKINLNNGERIGYVARRKKELISQLNEKRARLLGSFDAGAQPMAEDALHAHYRCFDALPIAFTDIEMVLDEGRNAVDWIFRYANPALARLEKVPLTELIGRSFKSVFPNMDSKWLKSYERAALYGETLELIDHSLEIDTYLKIICFPTAPGHCGCLLFDIAELSFAQDSGDAHNAKLRYFAKMLEKLV